MTPNTRGIIVLLVERTEHLEIVTMSHCVAKLCDNDNTKRDSVDFVLNRYAFGTCLDLAFVSIFDFLCVVCGARLAFATSASRHTALFQRSTFPLAQEARALNCER